MTPWDRFLKDLGPANRITIVGPMMQSLHTPGQPTIYVDGGVVARGSRPEDTSFPTISVGDGDSSPRSLDVVLPQEKDFSDLAFVLRSLPLSVRHLELLGFMGGRLDHQLANLGEVAQFLNRRTEFSTASLGNEVTAFGHGPLQLKIEGPFSLLALEACEVTIHGACRYRLVHPTFLDPLSSHGISNFGEGLITFTTTRATFIFHAAQEISS